MSDISKGATILSIGIAVPPNKISQESHHAILESANGLNRFEKLVLRKVYANSGINSRYSVLKEFGDDEQENNQVFFPASENKNTGVAARMKLFDEHALTLGARACISAMENAAIHPQQVTHLITFSCTGMSAPGIDIQLIGELGLNRNVERTCINFMGCYAAFNAMKIAGYIVAANPSAIVLACGVELCTLHYQKSKNNDQMIANALFSDGAAATIIAAERKGEKGFRMTSFYSEFEPAGMEEMAWKIGDHAFDIRLSSYVPSLIGDHIGKLLEKLFTHSGIRRQDLDHFAIHPGGVKILEACEKALDITSAQNKYSYEVLSEYGNMSSVTIMFVLEKYLRSYPGKNKKILACAFGPGLTLESMIITTA